MPPSPALATRGATGSDIPTCGGGRAQLPTCGSDQGGRGEVSSEVVAAAGGAHGTGRRLAARMAEKIWGREVDGANRFSIFFFVVCDRDFFLLRSPKQFFFF